MMFKEVPPKPKFPELEKEILKFWDENKIFQRSIDRREDCPNYVFYDGPPGTNGPPHIGHMMQSALKDLWPRYKTMKGYRVLRKAGWDTHGLPVELAAEKELGIKTKRDIPKFGADKFIEYCRTIVSRYKTEWGEAIHRIGRFLDLSHPYATLTNDYIQSDWWVLKQAWELELDPEESGFEVKDLYGSRKLLYKDFRILPFCPRCGTSLSNFEVDQGYRDISEITLYVKFPVRGEANTYFVAWTTTAWTLLSNVALAVGPEVDYVTVRVKEDGEEVKKGERLILARDRLGDIRPYVGELEILSTRKGKDLAGMGYEPQWDFLRQPQGTKVHQVVADDYVTTEEGTGIVHLALYGQDDFRIIRAHGFPLIQNIDENGYGKETAGAYAGRYFKEENLDLGIMKDLDSHGLLLGKERYEHRYPFCFKCETALMYFARPAWFIRTTAFRNRMIEANRHINWQPDFIKEGRFGDWLKNIIDWNISRERYWGSPLPIWSCSEKGCRGQECIGSLAELRQKAVEDIPDGFDPHKPHIDRIHLPCPECGRPMSREDFVLDSWFNAGLMPWGQWGYPAIPGSGKVFENQYPADFICEAIDQTRGWFYTLLACSTLVTWADEVLRRRKRPPSEWSCYRNVICTELVLDKNGKKMSKTFGNVVDPMPLLEQYGADAVRWAFYASHPWTVMRFSDDLMVEAIKKIINPLWNAYSFFVTYANIDGWAPRSIAEDWRSCSDLDRWIFSRAQRIVSRVTKHLDAYDVAPAAASVTDFLDDLTNWYIRRSRRRFWKSENDEDKHQAYLTLYTVLTTLLKVLAPFVPFLAEALYQNLVRSQFPDAPQSVHLEDFPSEKTDAIDDDLEVRMGLARRVVYWGRSLRNRSQIKVRQPLSRLLVYLPHKPEAKIVKSMEPLIAEELNIREIRLVEDRKALFTLKGKPNFQALGKKFGPRTQDIADRIRALSQGDLKQLAAGNPLTIDDDAITAEEVTILREVKGNLLVLEEDDAVVALDPELTPELMAEGLAREFVHQIQNLRKKLGLNVTDRIRLFVFDQDKQKKLQDALETQKDYVRTETLTRELRFTTREHLMKLLGEINEIHEIKINQYQTSVGLTKIES